MFRILSRIFVTEVSGDMRRRCALLILLAFATPVAAEPYEVGAGDVLTISIFGYDDLTGDYAVRSDGTVGLHLVGRIAVAGLDLPEVESALGKRALETFGAEPSILVNVAQYRDVFVTGAVGAPGAYPYRPGLTVVQALALAGGVRQAAMDASNADDQRAFDAQRRVMQTEAALETMDRRLAAVQHELSSFDNENADIADAPDTAEGRLFDLRRQRLEREIDQAQRQERLAETEAASMLQRRELIEAQRQAVDDQLQRTEDLVARGLSPRDQLMNLRLDSNAIRADALEATAFEARARQTAANAQSAAEIAKVDYRERLLAERMSLEAERENARAEYRTSLGYLQKSGAVANVAGADFMIESYEVIRGDETLRADLQTRLKPGDVLVSSLEIVADASN